MGSRPKRCLNRIHLRGHRVGVGVSATIVYWFSLNGSASNAEAIVGERCQLHHRERYRQFKHERVDACRVVQLRRYRVVTSLSRVSMSNSSMPGVSCLLANHASGDDSEAPCANWQRALDVM